MEVDKIVLMLFEFLRFFSVCVNGGKMAGKFKAYKIHFSDSYDWYLKYLEKIKIFTMFLKVMLESVPFQDFGFGFFENRNGNTIWKQTQIDI